MEIRAAHRNRSVAAQVVTDAYATGMLIVYLIQACILNYAFMFSMQYEFTVLLWCY